MRKWVLIRPVAHSVIPGEETGNPRMEKVLTAVREELRQTYGEEVNDIRVISRAEELLPVHDACVLFAISLDISGINIEWFRMTDRIRRDPEFFRGCIGGAIVDGKTELYTKAVGRRLILTANMSGCLFPGRPLVEGTGSLYNFRVAAKRMGTDDFLAAYCASAADLVSRMRSFVPPHHNRPKLLVMHSSVRSTSNTLNLWEMIKRNLSENVETKEIALQNGTINDCIGCHYKTCMHFAQQQRCYYGGVVVDEIYPALSECDALMILCPNYNDSLSANISASINRMTALYRRRQFYDKYLYGVIVSGYSGGDLVAGQLLNSLSLNKSFILPPHFAIMETANDPGTIRKVKGVEERAAEFAGHISCHLTGEEDKKTDRQ